MSGTQFTSPDATLRMASGAGMWERAAYLARRINDRTRLPLGYCFEAAYGLVWAPPDRFKHRITMAQTFRMSPYPKVRKRASELWPR